MCVLFVFFLLLGFSLLYFAEILLPYVCGRINEHKKRIREIVAGAHGRMGYTGRKPSPAQLVVSVDGGVERLYAVAAARKKKEEKNNNNKHLFILMYLRNSV